MFRRIVSGLMLTLLLVGMLTLVFDIRPVKAGGTIYIRPNGTVYPSTSPISRVGDVYTFTDKIHETIVVERDDITIDGRGYELQGAGIGIGLNLSYRYNVTVQNVIISSFEYGMWLQYSDRNSLTFNTVSNNSDGIYLFSSNNSLLEANHISNNVAGVTIAYSRNNTFAGNFLSYNSLFGLVFSFSCNSTASTNMFSRNWAGTVLEYSSFISLTSNIITDNAYGIIISHANNNTVCINPILSNYYYGIGLFSSFSNVLTRNSIKNNHAGIWLSSSRNNKLYHNFLVRNTYQVHDQSWDSSSVIPSINVWDDGYPSGGNYWSDHNATDLLTGPYQNVTGSDGIGDTPFIIDDNNRDSYPLMDHWTSLAGDLNNDGKVDIQDIALAASAFGSYPGHPRWNPLADINKDGIVSIIDIVLIAKNFRNNSPTT